jgi:hypothetical protein
MVVAMKTKIMHIDNIPNELELTSLLGEKSYKYYHKLCEAIISQLSPDLEIWDHAGRRGKYFHGYRINKQSMLVDLYLCSANGQENITCEFHFIKRDFIKLVKRKDFFREQIQKNIEYSIKFNEKYGGGFYIDVIIRDEETLQDAIQIIQTVSKTMRGSSQPSTIPTATA